MPPVKKTSQTLTLPWYRKANACLGVGMPRMLLLVGEPGTGKTTYAQQAARAATGAPAEVLSGTPEVEQSQIFGRWVLTGSDTKFQDGPLPRALKENRWLIIEEFSQIPLECRSALLPLRDQSFIVNPLSGERLEIPADFRLIATSNPESVGCRRDLGVARVLYDGFFILEVPELTEETVMAFLKCQFPEAGKKQITRTVELWTEYRNLGSQGESNEATKLSYRAASHLMALLHAGLEEPEAIELALVNKFLITDPDTHSAAKIRNQVA